jgi:hypothetical protein
MIDAPTAVYPMSIQLIGQSVGLWSVTGDADRDMRQTLCPVSGRSRCLGYAADPANPRRRFETFLLELALINMANSAARSEAAALASRWKFFCH